MKDNLSHKNIIGVLYFEFDRITGQWFQMNECCLENFRKPCETCTGVKNEGDKTFQELLTIMKLKKDHDFQEIKTISEKTIYVKF